MIIRSDVCKNLEYISLLQSRAMQAEPSKMHRNRPLAVHPATILLTYKDFFEQKSAIAMLIEDRGHKCIFILKFHCKLNAIKMY